MKNAPLKPVRVVIVGGGFGGRYAAKRLAYRLPAGSDLILVDRNDYMLYTPLLTEVAGRSVSPTHIQAANQNLSRRVTCLRDEVESADLATRTVTLASGQTLAADHLLFALGSTTNYRNIDGAEKHSLTMKTLDDARRVRTLAQRRVERAAEETSAEQRKRLLTFVVAGGGYTGVETIAALNDLVRDTASRHAVPASDLQLTLIEPAKRLMAEMPEDLAAYGQRRLEADGIHVRIGVGVERVEDDSLILTDGEKVPAGLLIWDTGIRPNPLVDSFICPKGKKGGIATDSAFRVSGLEGVWAIGDCAEVPKPDGSGHFFEPTAQNATRQGTHVADNILAAIRGRSVMPFRYKQIGALAVVSRHGGVANVYGVRVSGVLAWLLWRGVYLAKMPGLRQRVGIVWDWIRLATGRQHVPVNWRLSPPPPRAPAGAKQAVSQPGSLYA